MPPILKFGSKTWKSIAWLHRQWDVQSEDPSGSQPATIQFNNLHTKWDALSMICGVISSKDVNLLQNCAGKVEILQGEWVGRTEKHAHTFQELQIGSEIGGQTPAEANLACTLSVQLTVSKRSATSSLGPLSNLIETTITIEKWSELDLKFNKAMHGTATPVSFFHYPLWYDFFSASSPGWKLPSRTKISGKLLHSVYNQTITDTF